MNDERLSEAGRARREAMLGALRREVAARGRRRVAARAGAGLAVAGVLVVGGVALMRARTAQAPDVPERIADLTPAPATEADPAPPLQTPDRMPVAIAVGDGAPAGVGLVQRVQPGVRSFIRPMTADGTMVMRAGPVGTPAVADASDESLARALRDAGVAAGVARVGERVMVVPDRVVGEG